MEIQEAVERLEFLNEALNFQRADADESSCALQMAIKALEEIQQYRALGLTPTQIYEKIGGLDVELGKYHSLGTVEELRVARDKQVAKKAEWKFDDFTATFGNPYHCTNCDEEFGDTYNYCPNCGCDMYAG